MGIESRRARYYVEIPNLIAKSSDTSNNDKFVLEFYRGDFTNANIFISSYLKLCTQIGSRFTTKEFSSEDAVSEAFLAVCLVPKEINEGKYNAKIPIDNYVKSRIKSRCLNQARKNWLLRVPWHAAKNGVRINRKNVIFPGEVIGNIKPVIKPVDVISTLSTVDEEPIKEDIKVKLTSGERQIINMIKEGYNVAQIAKKLGVHFNTVKYRIRKLKEKCERENFFPLRQ